jgi:hypothetical protein
MTEVVSTSETWVNFYRTTRRNIPEDSHFQVAAVRTLNLSTMGKEVTVGIYCFVTMASDHINATMT